MPSSKIERNDGPTRGRLDQLYNERLAVIMERLMDAEQYDIRDRVESLVSDLAAQLAEAVGLVERWVSMLPPLLDLGRLPYAELRENTKAFLARVDAGKGGK